MRSVEFLTNVGALAVYIQKRKPGSEWVNVIVMDPQAYILTRWNKHRAPRAGGLVRQVKADIGFNVPEHHFEEGTEKRRYLDAVMSREERVQVEDMIRARVYQKD